MAFPGETAAAFFESMAWNALEATLLAAGVAAAGRLFRLSPAVRHLLWLLVVVKLLCPPVAWHPLGLSGARAVAVEVLRTRFQGEEVSAAGAAFTPALVRSPDHGPLDALPEEGAPIERRLAGPAELAGGADPSGPVAQGGFLLAAPRPSGLFLLSIAWLGGSLTILGLELFRMASLRATFRRARPAPAGILIDCRAVSLRLGLRRPPEVKLLEERISPMVWTLGRPVVILPRELEAAHGPLVQNVLAHEMSHLKRRDHWWSWIELLGSCAYWWLPTFWWARRGMRQAADQACDAWAVSALGCRKTYAESFFAIVELLGASRLPVPVWVRSLGEREAIERRLIMILRDPLRPRLTPRAWLGIAAVALLTLPAAPQEGLKAQVALPAPAAPAVAADELEPADAAGEIAAPVPDPERRLRSLERKVERILEELEALRGGAAPSVWPKAGRAAPEARRSALELTLLQPPATPRAAVSVSPSRKPDPQFDIPGRPQIAPMAGAPVGREAAPGGDSMRLLEHMVEKAGAGFEDVTATLSLSPEEREGLEKLNRKFRERMEKLRREHREAILECLRGMRPSDRPPEPEGASHPVGK